MALLGTFTLCGTYVSDYILLTLISSAGCHIYFTCFSIFYRVDSFLYFLSCEFILNYPSSSSYVLVKYCIHLFFISVLFVCVYVSSLRLSCSLDASSSCCASRSVYYLLLLLTLFYFIILLSVFFSSSSVQSLLIVIIILVFLTSLSPISLSCYQNICAILSSRSIVVVAVPLTAS